MSLLLFAITSCKKTELTPVTPAVSPDALNVTSTAAARNTVAQPFNIQYDFDLSGFTFYDDCTGEVIDLSGNENIVIHGVYNGTISKFDEHVNLQSVKGVGESSGKKYVVIDNFKLGDSYNNNDGTFTFTVMETFQLTTAGPANNYYVQFALAYTYNFSTGAFTIKRDKFNIGCR